MFDTTKLQADPSNPGWVFGWAVVRNSPWHLAGIHPDEQSARANARGLGDGYQVEYGCYRLGSDDFISGDSK